MTTSPKLGLHKVASLEVVKCLTTHRALTCLAPFLLLHQRVGQTFTSHLSSRCQPPEIHTTAREPKRAHLFEGPGASNNTKTPREDPEREKERKWRREKEKKKRNFGLPPLGGPTFSEFGSKKVHESGTQKQHLCWHVEEILMSFVFCFHDLLCELFDGGSVGNVSHHPRHCCHQNRHP